MKMMEAANLIDGDGLMADLARSARHSSDAYLATARATLLQFLAQADYLNRMPLARVSGGFTRNLLFGTKEISVWAMVWSPGASTPVHDHHCSCCFGLLSGTLRETWYRPISETHAVATIDKIRAPGFVACMMPSGPNLHRMANDGPLEAISIHVYGYDHRVHQSSVHRTYTVAAA